MLTIGIDFGGTTVKVGVCQDDRILEKLPRIKTKNFHGAQALIEEMALSVRQAQSKYSDIRSIGVGVPGFVDWKSGMVHKLTNVPGWDEIPLKQRLESMTGLPVVVENDANAMAYCEWRLGAGKGSETMVAITLGTGVGGGLIIGGELFHGASSGAGEIGQMSIDYRGRPGPYNNSGAIERYIGHQHVTARAVDLFQKKGLVRTAEECTPENIALWAHEGDPLALRLWEEVADELATALSNVVWLLNPDRIVIGGGMAKAGDPLFEPLRRFLKGKLNPHFTSCLEIVPAAFENEAGILGTAILAADAVRPQG